MPTVDEIVEASKGGFVKYEAIEFKKVKLLMTVDRLKPSIDRTWELTHDPEVEKLADEMGIKLRRRLR